MTHPRLTEDQDAMLVAYVDGALDQRQAAEAERLIEADSRAREAVEVFRRTAALLRSACGEQFYPPVPRRATTPMRPAPRRWALAAAASVLIGVGGFGSGALWRGTPDSDPLAEIAEYHGVFSRETRHLVELPPDRVEEMADWVGQGSRALDPPDLAAASLRLAGGRMLVIDGERVAELMYLRPHGPPVGLCVQRAKGADAPIRLEQRDGLRLAVWSAGGRRYTLVGELDAGSARDIASRAGGRAGA